MTKLISLVGIQACRSRSMENYKNHLKENISKVLKIEDHEKAIIKLKEFVTCDDPEEPSTELSDDKPILKVFVYRVPLTDWQPFIGLFNYMFIVFETDKWWWSIEKHTDGITIQRSRIQTAVQGKYRQKSRRKRITLIEDDEGQCSVFELIEWLYRKKELKRPYMLFTSNCKDFAKAIFDYVAKSKRL